MSLEPISKMMCDARSHCYAIGYFESWSIDSLYGVLDAAEQMRSPVIIGFNGEFLSRAGRVDAERLALYGALGKAAAASASVPCGFIFNECSRDDWTRAAVIAGFNLVMPADPAAGTNDYARRVRELVEFARPRDVAVEAEVGDLPAGLPGFAHGDGAQTDPRSACEFVRATGVDLLAVSVGNVHVSLSGRTALDIDRLRTIRRAVEVPLVLHGGTGIADDSLREAIALGVAKVNYGTILKQRYLMALRRALASEEPNPHALLGMGGPEDIMIAGRSAVREAVVERIGALGSAGRA